MLYYHLYAITGSEVSGLPALLHAASLTVQLMQHGSSLQSGLREACMDVFVRSQLSQVNRQVSVNDEGPWLPRGGGVLS